VADVRSLPRSRTHPHFDQRRLPSALAKHGFAYVHIPELGGRRPKQVGVDPALNAYWTNRSFHNYADYALSDSFRRGLQKLLVIGRDRRCVVMCAEAVWWRCHRRIIADYLIRKRWKVRHILSPNKITEGTLTPGALPGSGGSVLYPRTEGASSPPAKTSKGTSRLSSRGS
jgi:uncharacterized protein (DUF488 family)